MALQRQRLSMSGLSVRGDVPPNVIQPKLDDGIHLRWGFQRELGFPWYGFYLFRRESSSADRVLQPVDFGQLALGTTGAIVLTGPSGQVSSDVALVATDDFQPVGTSELDLDHRSSLVYIPSDLASEVRVEIGFRDDAEVVLTAFHEQIPVARARLGGQAGQVVSAELRFDVISSVVIGSAPAALVSLGFLSAMASPLAGWQAVPGFPSAQPPGAAYPLGLPVTHPDYPCPGSPANINDAELMALGRLKYAAPPDWTGTASFAALHGVLQTLVDGGPSGMPMSEKESAVAPVPPAPRLTMSHQAPLDLLLLGALHPGLAQMLGMYWLDTTVAPSVTYDYMVVADSEGVLGGTPTSALQYLRTVGFGDVDAFIVFDQRLDDPAPALEPPADVHAFALPAPTRTRRGATAADAGSVGLRWDRGVTSLGTLLPGKPILYHLWRADLGAGSAPSGAPSYVHRTTNGPVLIVDALVTVDQARPPPDWPPIRMYLVDRRLAEGWYGYQLNGVDIFGRHSANSAAAAWHQWKPAPVPLPWYYQPPASDAVVHPSAVGLLDKVPPPKPTAVEAAVLDPNDPLLVQDADYLAWRAALPANEKSSIGLRINWLWPQSHMDQAPDTREFRIYFNPGRQNTLFGMTVAVAAASATESTVTTDISNAQAADAFVGARLQIHNTSFRVLGSDAGTPLTLRVANIGPANEVRPSSKAPCSLVIPETVGAGTALRLHPLHVDYRISTSWDQRIYVVAYGDHVTEEFQTSTAPNGSELAGSAATVADVVVALDGSPDLSGVGLLGSFVQLDTDTARSDQRYRIMAVDVTTHKLTLDAAPSLTGTSSAWSIGRLLRRYEVFLPEPGDTDRSGAPVSVTAAEPLVYGSIGVSAADDKQHTDDAAKWASGRWGGQQRFGNEGGVSPSATIYAVYRAKPPPPDLPTYPDERVWATHADYHSRSVFTFRWVAATGLKAHVLRALDDTLFKTDWLIRSTRAGLAPTVKAHAALFPPAWAATRKQTAAAQLNSIASKADYAGLSPDGRELVARLPGNEGPSWGSGLEDRDWEIRRTRTGLGAGDAAYFPADWNATGAANVQKRQDVATALNAVASNTAYRALSFNAQRVLASLPGNEAAFSQLTIHPLDPGDPATADRRGPDSPDAYAPSTTLRAFEDTLDGRSSSRYFYRALHVNPVHTRGALSLSTPPVCCPDVVPPRAPIVTKVLGGDRSITLRWASNREPDLARYLVYRAAHAAQAREVRLMELVYTEQVPVSDPATRGAQVTWTDNPVAGGTTYHYRLLAVDTAGNVSEPSASLAGRAVDRTPPAPPQWERLTWVLLDESGQEHAISTTPTAGRAWVRTIALEWSTLESCRVLVQRSIAGGVWHAASPWLEPNTFDASRSRCVYQCYDPGADPLSPVRYRLKVESRAGNLNVTFDRREVVPP